MLRKLSSNSKPEEPGEQPPSPKGSWHDSHDPDERTLGRPSSGLDQGTLADYWSKLFAEGELKMRQGFFEEAAELLEAAMNCVRNPEALRGGTLGTVCHARPPSSQGGGADAHGRHKGDASSSRHSSKREKRQESSFSQIPEEAAESDDSISEGDFASQAPRSQASPSKETRSPIRSPQASRPCTRERLTPRTGSHASNDSTELAEGCNKAASDRREGFATSRRASGMPLWRGTAQQEIKEQTLVIPEKTKVPIALALILCYIRLKRWEPVATVATEALETFGQQTEIRGSPQFPQGDKGQWLLLLVRRGVGYSNLGPEHYHRAEADFDAALRCEPRNKEALRGRKHLEFLQQQQRLPKLKFTPQTPQGDLCFRCFLPPLVATPIPGAVTWA